jgi:hypothetical protein
MIFRQALKRICVIKARQLGISTLLGIIAADQLCWKHRVSDQPGRQGQGTIDLRARSEMKRRFRNRLWFWTA